MRKVLETILGGVLALGLSSCAASQIGIDYRMSRDGRQILQEQVLTKGRCFFSTRYLCQIAKSDYCKLYTDTNKNGKIDPEVDWKHSVNVHNEEGNCFDPDDPNQLIIGGNGEVEYYFKNKEE